MGSAGKIAMEEERGTCEMLIELHPLIEMEKRVPIVPLSPGSHVRCEETVSLLSNTSHLCTVRHSSTGTISEKNSIASIKATVHLFQVLHAP